MLADVFTELPIKILSECGLVSGLLATGIIWLAIQLAKNRAACEADRASMMQILRAQDSSYSNLATAHAKLEGMVLGIDKKR